MKFSAIRYLVLALILLLAAEARAASPVANTFGSDNWSPAQTSNPVLSADYLREGNRLLFGEGGSLENPSPGSGLEYRAVFLSQGNTTESLRAHYESALEVYQQKTHLLDEAEFYYRSAIKTNRYNLEAKKRLLEVYYARAEAYLLIGEQFLIQALEAKYRPISNMSVTLREIEAFEKAHEAFVAGYGEFTKLFHHDYRNHNGELQPDLFFLPLEMFFRANLSENFGEGLVSVESLRGENGYKDIEILFRLLEKRLDVAHEIVVRRYRNRGFSPTGQQDLESALQWAEEQIRKVEEVDRRLIEESLFSGASGYQAASANAERFKGVFDAASRTETAKDRLENEIRDRRSGLSEFGYPDDFVLFYHRNGQEATYNNIQARVQELFQAASASEVSAARLLEEVDENRDRLRTELRGVTERSRRRLVQIVGQVTNGEVDAAIQRSWDDTATEIGRQALTVKNAESRLAQAREFLKNLEREIVRQKAALENTVQNYGLTQGVLAQYQEVQSGLDERIGELQAKITEVNGVAEAIAGMASGFGSAVAAGANSGGSAAGAVFGSAMVSSAVRLNAAYQVADLQREIGRVTGQKTKASYQERIELIGLQSELYQFDQAQRIQALIDQFETRKIDIDIAYRDVAIAAGTLSSLLLEIGEIQYSTASDIEFLGSLRYAGNSKLLAKTPALEKAEAELDLLKQWLVLWLRSLCYKWAMPLGEVYLDQGLRLSESMVSGIRVVGALDRQGNSPLYDELTADAFINKVIQVDERLSLARPKPLLESRH